jgi:4-hydroxy-3-polyprenylbenzoate decarboxylase
MGYRTLRDCVDDLAATGQLLRIEEPVSADLEIAQIHRRVFRAGGPAIYFARVAGCRFPMVGNLLGTIERARYIFRDALRGVRRLVELNAEPGQFWRRPSGYPSLLRTALSIPVRRRRTGPVLANETSIDQLPRLVSWPDDGGGFITLPLVYTEDIGRPGPSRANLGMYRIQLSGGRYAANREVGLHYQIHRGIGVHHAAALRAGEPLRVNVFVGGAPAMWLAAVMPLPEGMSELLLAGALGRRRVPMIRRGGQLPIYAEADFCITGTVDPQRRLPEGPFGDHLGYYSREHDFPVLRVDHVYHRDGAIWPFTVVGRPPQEDSVYGQLIHELTAPVIPTVLPGVHGVHAVDAAGVHPLLLAIGSERYTPFEPTTRPQELLTQANAILGQGQLSLAKYVLIVSRDDAPDLRVDDVAGVLQHLLERADWTRDLHFQTRTTVDTLDYTGPGLNQGSKLVIAAVGPPRRKLPHTLPGDFRLPEGFRDPRVVLPGVLAVVGPRCESDPAAYRAAVETFCAAYSAADPIAAFPWVVVVDDSRFMADTLDNFLWVTFTRTDPAADLYGIEASVQQKHWGCRGSLVIDARQKPHHAPPLLEDPETTRRVDALAAPGGPLHGVI